MFTGFYRVFSPVYWVSLSSTGFYRVVTRLDRFQSFINFFSRFLPGFTGFSLGFTGFSLGFTGFYWLLLGFIRFYWVLLGFHWVLLGFTRFYWDLRSATKMIPKENSTLWCVPLFCVVSLVLFDD